ncbi:MULTISPECIES: DNA repair exonuclease [Sulfitobacter]|uniref:metallophosphoesterase family protein n=1 Tax=Sulfitobacter TaxID=60136 RepID=UPI002307894C|nr:MULTISPECIES: DNA repair exonuclease [Sulfitobacter]MDF3382978.1 DNA repair exonuclease [Sulfitobacter sp. Ks11]MDF3386397.1 DNA repair exonuclease [Sulfitobacter sp. M85]MDF3389816.1 DNA repair exonuclease [Sulfitobacter sp. Ks16]MDF3400453.1 DNA repair exonuclease [Sulfitobacter sp. KE39]MDF3403874.1 DNA repair exonuclease [Sulfitobacter sp. Ks35]
MTFRFIHASDLHIGRKFANIPQAPDGNIRGRLMEARHGAIAKLAQAARDHGAAHVLLAGDTFDTATPSASVLRQALTAMGEAAEMTWWLLPGNHDNLRDAEPLWEVIARDAPPNLRALTEAAPIEMVEGVSLLPCPVAFRAGASDPSAPLDRMHSPEGHMRIALAHGGVTDFTDSGEAIAPDRDQRARLDYLALGDWHGRMAVSDRVHYCGTPEQDRFKHGRRGVCLAVEIAGPGARPKIEEVETGSFLWSEAEVTLHPRQDVAAALQALLPETGRRDHLLRVKAGGWASLPDRAALAHAAQACAPDFAHFELLTEGLGTQYEAADLDEIDRGGALRMAAETLVSEAQSETLPQSDRDVAADALARLHAYVQGAKT